MEATVLGTNLFDLPQREVDLLRAAKYLGPFSEQLVEATARLVLGDWSTEKLRSPFRSRLNNDGSPLQLCLVTSQHGRSARLIGDPGSNIPQGHKRLGYALATLDHILSVSSDSVFKRLTKDMFAINSNFDYPNSCLDTGGPLWLAKPFIGNGLAVYTNTRWGSSDSRWKRVRLWLDNFAPRRSLTLALLDTLIANTEVASIGIEGYEGDNSRGKIYFRLRSPLNLGQLGLDFVIGSRLMSALETLICDRQLPLSGIVFSIGISRFSGEVIDAKIDVCGHCLTFTKSLWQEVLLKCTDILELPPLYRQGEFMEGAVAFVGVAVSKDNHARMNLYLKSYA